MRLKPHHWLLKLINFVSFEQRLAKRLAEQQSAGRTRVQAMVSERTGANQSVAGVTLVNFCSNDYLGLTEHPALKEAAIEAATKWGVGSGAAHLVSGHSEHHGALETAIAKATGYERAILFSTGYMANMALATALVEPGQWLLGDRLNHASIIDGCLLAGSKSTKRVFYRYNHADCAHLETLLQKAPKHSVVITDGVFSMDGDIAPLGELSALCHQYEALLVVDDAHGFGALSSGAGCATKLGLSASDVPVYMGTLGKTAGSFGAFVAGSDTVIETLMQFARPYIYTTALPPMVAAASLAAVKIIADKASSEGDILRAKLAKNIALFRARMAHLGDRLMPSMTAIQPVVVGEEMATMNIAASLKALGFWVGAIRPPTVPIGSSRLRVTLSAAHTEEQVAALCDALDAALGAQVQ